jgi:anionic cell wall polymer biosynthesis LytR-Cps2A-Psr (LCP) family protein
MHMDGEHALMFARIRGLDSDVGRTERQRRVILAIMSQFKGATVSEMNAAVNTLLPNIKTSMSKSEILNYASKAVTDGWGKFPITQMSMPT